MKSISRLRTRWHNAAALVCCVVALLSAPRAEATTYTIQDLGAVTPTAISNFVGVVIGNAPDFSGWTQGYYCVNGLQEFFPPHGYLGGAVIAISGVHTVGTVISPSVLNQAAAWWNGSIQATILAPLPGTDDSFANGVNASRRVVGWAHPVQSPYRRACLWDLNKAPLFLSANPLGVLGGGDSVANGVNDNGWVVGTANAVNGDFHAYLWVNGAVTDLHNYAVFPDGDSQGMAINLAGAVVGFAFVQHYKYYHAFINWLSPIMIYPR